MEMLFLVIHIQCVHDGAISKGYLIVASHQSCEIACSDSVGRWDQTGNMILFNCFVLRKLSAVSLGYQSTKICW